MTKSDDIRKLEQLRDHHRQQAQRCDDALALMRDIAKMNLKAGRVLAKVQRRAAGERRHTTPARSTIDRAKKQAGVRPVDRAASALAAAKGAPLTRAQIAADLRPHIATSNRYNAEGNAQRVAGLVLQRLVAERRAKRVGDGYVATAKLNGAPAS